MNSNSPTLNGNLTTGVVIALLLYLLFVIYGSLVPLHFVAKPIDEAITQFQQIPYLALGIRSRADWVANILLFIPLSFLLSLLLLERDVARATKVGLALGIWCLCSLLAVGIEFTQIFFPQRTVSINDIVAEGSGAAIGILIYYFKGKQLKQFIAAFIQMRGKDSVLSYLLLSYIAVFALYNVLPLDLTLSPVELYKKWREGRIVLIPFTGYKGSVIEIGYAVLSDILLWVPIAVLLYLQQIRHKALYVRVLLLALLLEFCQLFVYSRVTDISDVLCALIASWGSIIVLKRWRPENTEHVQLNLAHLPMLKLLAAILLYALVILILLWYPFNFNFDWSTINARLQHAQAKVLLESLYFGTEYRAITALLQKLILFMPLGALFAAVYQRCNVQWQRQVTLTVAVGFITGLALLSEAMQLALPGKTVDATDVLLECLGAAAGFALLLFITSRIRHKADNPHENDIQTVISTTPFSAFTPKFYLIAHALISLFVLFAVSYIPGLPYNVKELLTDNWTALPAIGIAMYLLVLPAAYPFGSFARFIALTPLYALPQALILFWLLFLCVPQESLFDILGAPVSNWPKLELMLRFIGFVSLFQFNCLAAMQFIQSKQKVVAAILWLIINLLVASLWYLAVVHFAATDNIVELLADNGSLLAIMALTGFVMLLYYAAARIAQTACPLSTSSILRLGVVIALSLLLGWQLIQLATETVIVKYQQAFSALQFLLSTDRQHYLPTGQLLPRFMLAFSAIIVFQSWFYLFVRLLHNSKQTAPVRP